MFAYFTVVFQLYVMTYDKRTPKPTQTATVEDNMLNFRQEVKANHVLEGVSHFAATHFKHCPLSAKSQGGGVRMRNGIVTIQ